MFTIVWQCAMKYYGYGNESCTFHLEEKVYHFSTKDEAMDIFTSIQKRMRSEGIGQMHPFRAGYIWAVILEGDAHGVVLDEVGSRLHSILA